MDIIPVVWLGLMVLFLVVEASCPLHLVSLWFALGCLGGLAVWAFHGPVWLQFGVFLALSCALLICLWPLSTKYFTPKLEKTNIDSIIGSTGYVTAPIDNTHAQGQVKLGAMEWTARSTSGEPIPADTLIRVDRIEGVKVIVSPVEVLEKV